MENLGELTDIDYSLAIPNHEDYTSSALCVLHQLIYEVGDEYKIPANQVSYLVMVPRQCSAFSLSPFWLCICIVANSGLASFFEGPTVFGKL